VPYLEQADLENALGASIVASIFDDDHDGVADAEPLAACLLNGEVECEAFLSTVYDETKLEAWRTETPRALKFAAVDFACAYAARRRPDIVRAMGEEPWTAFRNAAEAKLTAFIKAQRRIVEETPTAIATPANVGSTVRVGGAAVSPDCPVRVFDKMGDFS